MIEADADGLIKLLNEFIKSLLKQQRDENDLLKSALEYIVRLESKKHLGHPRLTDKNCIFCQAYFAINNGAFGYTVSKEYYNGLSTHQNQKEK